LHLPDKTKHFCVVDSYIYANNNNETGNVHIISRRVRATIFAVGEAKTITQPECLYL